MLREIQKIQQHKAEPFRRWFTDNYFDLIVWHSNEEIIGFQLCYDKGKKECAFTWQKESGYLHSKIDDGENRPYTYKMTPILVSDSVFEYKGIADRFKKESKEIDAGIAQFIYEKLLQFPSVKKS